MLKALELAGFKSFADRTRFEFPDGITVVVGPNGSGKSNVVDAIKWVLGEQSARSLRGGEMADVIFKGSDASGRKPANTAEATLVFDNRDKRLDVDADEVEITRRVFRSGEGEYLINKRPCRLRDIRDVFRGTGMGTDAYSLIEQGKVDTLLQASPRDRRAIFEEAAGISRFKAKKVEALRRLERVDQNLLRLSDIVDELDGRLRRLRAQAGKARRYQEYTERLQQLRTQVGLADFRSLSHQLDVVEQRTTETRRQVERLAAEREASEAQRLECDTEREMAEETLRGTEFRVANQRQQMVALRAGAEGQLQRHSELHDESLRLGRRQLAFQQNTGQADRQLELARADLAEAERELEQLSERDAAERSRMDASRQQVAALQAQLTSLRQRLSDQQRDTTEMESQIAYWSMRRQELTDSMDQSDRRKQAIEMRGAETRRACDMAEIAYQHAQRDEQEARAAWDGCQQELTALQQQLHGALERLAERRRRGAALRERASVLKELEQQQEGLHTGTRDLLARAAAGQHPYDDIAGMVADLLHVDVEIAQMVDIALGERSQYLVARGDRLLHAIESSEFVFEGRVGLIGLIELQHAAGATQPESDWLHHLVESGCDPTGVMGPAWQFVETATEYSGLIAFLLGDVWFAETLADARRQLLNGHTGRWVTRDGHVCEPGGIVALRANRQRYQIISRRSELRQLQQQMSDSEQAVQDDEAIVAKHRAQQSGLQDDLATRQRQWELAQEHLQQAQLARQQAQQQHERLQFELAACREESQTLATQRHDAESKEHDLRRRLEQLQEQSGDVAREVQQLEQQSQLLSLQRDEEAQQVARVMGDLARWQQTVTHRRDELSRWQQEQSQRDQIEADLREQRERNSHALHNGQLALLVASSELADVYGQLDREESAVLEVRQRLRSLMERRRELTQLCRDLQRQQQQVEDTLHRDQLELERVRQTRDALVARCAEDYELDLVTLAGTSDASEMEAAELPPDEIAELRRKISNIGAVNMEALQDLQALESRYEELAGQYRDLQSAQDALQRIIHKISTDSKRVFTETLQHIRDNFRAMFRKVFGGGEADIVLDDSDDDALERGIDIIATPPGKQSLRLSLLSGGERALTAVTLLLAIFQYRPSPFCVLDEVDGPLDEANIGRFIAVLHEFLCDTKFVIVTHSKVTMTAASTLYGITMQESGVSKQVSVRFEDVSDGGNIAAEALTRSDSEDAA